MLALDTQPMDRWVFRSDHGQPPTSVTPPLLRSAHVTAGRQFRGQWKSARWTIQPCRQLGAGTNFAHERPDLLIMLKAVGGAIRAPRAPYLHTCVRSDPLGVRVRLDVTEGLRRGLTVRSSMGECGGVTRRTGGGSASGACRRRRPGRACLRQRYVRCRHRRGERR